MSKYKILLLVFFLSVAESFSQTMPQWRRLTSAPLLANTRHDDGWFVTPNLGWVVNGLGQIRKTTDGGATWTLQFDQGLPTNKVYFRSVTFADSLRGWACNLGTEEFGGAVDTNIIYQTTNGGATWTPNNNITPGKPRGICGIQAVGDSMVYAVGRVRGPAHFLRSTDRGNTWQRRDMSLYVMGLLDVYFWNADSGIVVGHTGALNRSSNGRVLYTTDRGNTWRIQHTSSRIGEWCWKINFPTRRVGYVSLQRDTGSVTYFLKTTDGGITWQEKLLMNRAYYVQGIGFATETRGWVGGNTAQPSYGTTNGGDTWFPDTIGPRMNRFRMINDTLGFGMGSSVYKYSITPAITSVADEAKPTLPEAFLVMSAFPNPFNPTTTIEYTLNIGADDPATPLVLQLKLFDVAGKEIATLLNEPKRMGTYRLQFDGSKFASGIYLARLEAVEAYGGGPMIPGNYVATTKLLLVK